MWGSLIGKTQSDLVCSPNVKTNQHASPKECLLLAPSTDCYVHLNLAISLALVRINEF